MNRNNKIENDKQYEVTKNWVEKFRTELDGYKNIEPFTPENVHPLIFEAHINSVKSVLADLEFQVKEYEDSKRVANKK